MKRLLCIVLSAVMLISLLPAVSLAVDAREEVIYSFASKNYKGVAAPQDITYKNSKNLLQFHGHQNSYKPDAPGGIWNGGYPCFELKKFSGTSDYLAYRIQIPATGEYNVTFKHLDRAGTEAEMYIFPADAINPENTDVSAAIKSGKYSPVITGIVHENTDSSLLTKNGKVTVLTAGEHIVAFVRVSNAENRVRPASLILTPYKEAVYKETTHSLPESEFTGREILFTVKMIQEDGGVYVPFTDGDGISVSLVENADKAELINVSCAGGIYSATLKTLAEGEVKLGITSTVKGSAVTTYHTLKVKKPVYSETVHNLTDIELVGKEINFTAKMMMSDGTVFVPEAEGDGISVTVLNNELAEVVSERNENGLYSGTLKTLSAGDARICLTATYGGVEHNTFYTLSIIDTSELSPISIEMTQDTMLFEDKTAPSVEWETDCFELVLDETKMTEQICRYTERKLTEEDGTKKLLVQLNTGYDVWPTVANSMFTIKKRVFAAGWYAVDFKGVTLATASDYSIYVNDEYAGDFVFYNENSTDATSTIAKEKKLNTVYLKEGYNEISFRAVRKTGTGVVFFIPHTITFTPVENQDNAPEVSHVASNVTAKIPVGERQNVTAHIEMSDGSYRHFGLANDGSEDEKNKVLDIVSENGEIVSVSDFAAPQFGDSDTFSFSIAANTVGTTKINVTAVINGEEKVLPVDVEVIDTPVLEKVELSLEKDKLYAGKTVGTDMSLIRSGDGKEYTDAYSVVSYESRDPSILTVDNGGYVTGIKEGTARVCVNVRDYAGNVVTGELEITVLPAPGLEKISIEMTQDTIRFADRSAPSEDWEADGFEFVLEPDKITTEIARYTPRYILALSKTKYFVQLNTGTAMWPQKENAMYTIKREFLKSGWYAVDFTGVVFAGGDDYAIYVDGKYAGDFVFGDPDAPDLPAGRYLKNETLNTIYIDEGNVEISFRARKGDGNAFFVPYIINFTPLEEQNAVKYANIETSMSAMLPENEEQNVTAKVKMSDGSCRHFGLANDGSEEAENKIISVEAEDSSVAEIIAWAAPSVGTSSDIIYTVKGKNAGSTNVLITVRVDGDEHTEEIPLEVIEKPTLASVEVNVTKEKLPATRTASASVFLTRTNDLKEYTYEVKNITYRLSEPGFAEIDVVTGEITGTNPGTVTVYADVTDWADNKRTGEKTITILPEPVLAEIKAEADTELLVGQTSSITAAAVMDDGESGDISKYALSYASSDENVATVSADGIITAVGAGRSSISVSAPSENGKTCVQVLDVKVYGALDALVVDFAKTETKIDYSQPDVTPGYTILTDIGKPTNYRMFDCRGTDMLQIKTGNKLWPENLGGADSSFAFSVDAVAEGDYGIELFGGVFYKSANYSVYVNGNYAGDYIFYSEKDVVYRTKGEKKALNTLHLNQGYNEIVIVLREMPFENNYPYMAIRNFTFTPRMEALAFADIEASVPAEIAVGEKLTVNAKVKMNDGTYRHFGPDYDTGSLEDDDNKITLTDPNGCVEIEKHTKIGDTAEAEFTLTAKKAGQTTLTYIAVIDGISYTREFPVSVKDDPLVATGAEIRPDEIYEGDFVYLYATPTLKSGKIIASASAENYFVSKNKDIATIDGDILTAHKAGTVTIEVTTVFNGKIVKGTTNIEVQEAGMTSVTITAGGSKIIRLTDKENDSVPLYVTATDNLGNEIDLTDAVIEAETDSETVIMDGNNEIFPQREGNAIFNVTATLPNGRMRKSENVTLRVVKGKSESTYYTPEKIEIARQNYKTLDWVKSAYASYITNADTYVNEVDKLYSLIPSEGIPRAICIGDYNDPFAYTCRYCNTDLMEKYGQFSWLHNPLQRPWQIQCPDCKRLFPSNDFESFYELGLNEYGEFDRLRALEAHREMLLEKGLIDTSVTLPGDVWSASWLKYYGYGVKGGYLYNKLYENDDLKEVKTLNGGKGLRPGEKQETWGVDDGYGYAPHDENGKPFINENGTIERHTYIAEYVHFGLWRQPTHSKSGGVIRNAIRYCSNAYMYTGDIKYGRTAAILIDRVADVYPDLDISIWNDEFAFANSDGGLDVGKRVGCIWECEEVQQTVTAYDMVFDVYEDSFVVEYLSNKSREVKMRHAKNTPSQIRTNIEDGIIRPALDGLRDCSVSGNFGLPQKANAICAVVLDSMPETAEWLDYLMAPGWVRSNAIECLGGGIDEVLMNRVDADGHGDEASQYNNNWNLPIIQIQEILEDYDRYDKANLLKNPKLRQLCYANIPLMTGYYTPQIGDSGTTAGTGHWLSDDLALAGWKYFKDPVFAQVLYYLNGNSSEGLRYSELEENPNRLEKEVQDVIEQYGEYVPVTEALPNFGFSVLRAGEDFSDTVGSTAKDASRDVWMYFGRNSGHGHADALNIGMRAFGLNFMPDHGYPKLTGSDPERVQWTSTTLSHNTAVVNEEAQRGLEEPRGQLLHLDDDGTVRLMDVSASYVYDAADEYRRSVIMIDAGDDVSYTVDFFRILGGNTHSYSFHASSNEIAATKGLALVPQKKNGVYSGTYAGINVPHGEDPGTNAGSLKYPIGYTWLKNVDRDEKPADTFEVDFKIKDFNKVIKDSSGLHLRMTIHNGTNIAKGATADVAIADGLPPQTSKNEHVDKMKYVVLRNRGNNLDTVFTTVFEPYRNAPYIESSTELEMIAVDGRETSSDAARAVKVTHISGRVDYVFYATNKNVTYKVSDVLENGKAPELLFRGFVGVYTVNEAGENIYCYVHDGDIIGKELAGKYAIDGVVKSFTREHLEENEIRILPTAVPTENELKMLKGRYVAVNNGELTRGGTYKIEKAYMDGNDLVLNIGRITLIRKYLDSASPETGYSYLIDIGQAASIPMTLREDNAPEFEGVGTVTTSAGSTVKVSINAKSPLERTLTYIGTGLPRGASVNADTGIVTWKPDSSQVGDNHVAVTVRDSDGRESTAHFIVTVYGSTTSKPSTDSSTSTENLGTSGAGTSSGGGDGGAVPAPDKPDDATNTDNAATSDKTDYETTEPGASGEADNIRFTDLDNHAWAEDAINVLASDGVIKGTSATTYSPVNNITRADFALLLVRAFNLTSDDTENFADVCASDYFATELAVARNTGIINGIGDNRFAPCNTITRQDMMVIVHRALSSLPLEEKGDRRMAVDEVLSQYPDFATVAEYAKPAVTALIGTGLVNGKNGLIAPTDYTTRAEVAVLIKRILDYTKQEVTSKRKN